jgi:hypothetical protein
MVNRRADSQTRDFDRLFTAVVQPWEHVARIFEEHPAVAKVGFGAFQAG